MRQFGVIGLGRFGSSVAKVLSEEGHQVLGVDIDEEVVQEASGYVTQSVQLDATDEKALRSIGMDNVDVAVVGVGDKIEASILITLSLKEIGIEVIVSKAVTENHGKVLQRVGATKVVFPERDMGKRIANSLISPKILEHIGLSSECSILEMKAPKDFIGKSLKELDLRVRYGLNVIAIRKAKKQMGLIEEDNIDISPKPDRNIEQDDIMVVIGSNKNIENVKKEHK